MMEEEAIDETEISGTKPRRRGCSVGRGGGRLRKLERIDDELRARRAGSGRRRIGGHGQT
jgi:hypothetical protein